MWEQSKLNQDLLYREAINGDVQDFSKSLQSLVYLFRQLLPNVALVAITPIPLADKLYLEQISCVRTDVVVLGQTFNVPVFDLWDVFNQSHNGYQSELMSEFVEDTHKLNAKGNSMIGAKLITFLKQRFPHLIKAEN